MWLEQIGSYIEALAPSADTWKDFIFPVLQTFLATLAGAYSAYLLFLRQERVLAGKKNVAVANQVMITAHSALQDLVRMKSDYSKRINSDPIKRAAVMYPQLSGVKRISFPIHDLGFLVYQKEKVPKLAEPHLDLLRLESLCINFNILCDFLDKRASVDSAIKRLMSEGAQSARLITSEVDLRKVVSAVQLAEWVDLTERCLSCTDGLIIELAKVLADFPMFASHMVIDKGGSKESVVFSIGLGGVKEFLPPVPIVDYRKLEAIVGIPEVELVGRYDSGYC